MKETNRTRAAHLTLLVFLVATSLYLNVMLDNTVKAIRVKGTMHDDILTKTRPLESYSFIGEDFPSYLPVEAPLVKMQVEESMHYAVNDANADREWLWTAPEGDNHIRLGPDRRGFASPMVHELHCLRNIQRDMERGLPPGHVDHTHHCLNYMRQWTLCSADVALEPGPFETRDFEVERVGATHTCRDWEAVYDFVRENWKDWVRYRAEKDRSGDRKQAGG